MRVRENIGFWIAALLFAAAGWIAGGGNTVSAQTGEIRDCRFTLFSDRHMSTGNFDRPDVFLLDECTGNTWIRSGRSWRTMNR